MSKNELDMFGPGYRFPDLWSRLEVRNFSYNPNSMSMFLICELQSRKMKENKIDETKTFLEITRHHLGGFGRYLGKILPTSHPELPLQLRDLRNNQNSLKCHFLETIRNA